MYACVPSLSPYPPGPSVGSIPSSLAEPLPSPPSLTPLFSWCNIGWSGITSWPPPVVVATRAQAGAGGGAAGVCLSVRPSVCVSLCDSSYLCSLSYVIFGSVQRLEFRWMCLHPYTYGGPSYSVLQLSFFIEDFACLCSVDCVIFPISKVRNKTWGSWLNWRCSVDLISSVTCTQKFHKYAVYFDCSRFLQMQIYIETCLLEVHFCCRLYAFLHLLNTTKLRKYVRYKSHRTFVSLV